MGMLTRRSFSTAMLGMLALLLALAAFAPLAHAAESESGVTFLDEGWWLRYREVLGPVPQGSELGLPDDTTEIPKAEARNQTNPYKGEYLRASTFPSDEGDETIAALGFDLLSLGDGMSEAQITGGTVTFVAAPPESAPGAGDGANGQRNEENAAMVACVATDFWAPDFAGNWDERPKYDPDTCAPLELTEEKFGEAERPSWTLDLAAFAGAWAEGNVGFVVVPDPEREGDGSFFHVAFPNTMNTEIDTEEYPPPTADITFEVEEMDIPDFGDTEGGDDFGTFDDAPADTSGDAGGFDSGSSESFDSGGSSGGFDSGGSSGGFDSSTADAPIAADEPELETAAPEAADGEEIDEGAAAAPVQTPTSSDEGGTNLAYLLVPLLGLGLAGTLGYSLSKDPELALEREGAVSKLMARRQAQGALGAGDA